MKKTQSKRLTMQHKETHGVIGIFGKEAKEHDGEVSYNSRIVMERLQQKYQMFKFRYR